MTKPRRAMPARMHTVPETIAIMRGERRGAKGIATGQRNDNAEDDSASAKSGPSTRMRLGPNNA